MAAGEGEPRKEMISEPKPDVEAGTKQPDSGGPSAKAENQDVTLVRTISLCSTLLSIDNLRLHGKARKIPQTPRTSQ